MYTKSSITVRFEDAQLNRVAGPPESASVDHDLHLKEQEQKAGLDAPHYDLPLWQTMQGKKAAGEIELDVWLATQQQEAANKIADAQSAANALESTQHTNLIVNGPGLQQDTRTTLESEKETARQITEDIATAEADRDDLKAILAGNQTDPEGTPWPGEAPAKPGPDTTHRMIRWSSANVRDKLLAFGPYLALGLVDGIIMSNNIKDYLRSDGWAWPVGLSVAFLSLLVALPSFIGKSLAKIMRRGSARANEIIGLALMLTGWIVAVAGSVYFRVTFDVNEAILKAAEATDTPPADIDLAKVYDLGMGIFTWTVAIAAVGILVIVLERYMYNPIIGQILRADHNLVDLYTMKNTHQVIVEKAQALVAGSTEAAKEAVANLQHHSEETLPAQASECAAHYRTWLIRYYGDPAYTTAIMGRGV